MFYSTFANLNNSKWLQLNLMLHQLDSHIYDTFHCPEMMGIINANKFSDEIKCSFHARCNFFKARDLRCIYRIKRVKN
jgi:hypothetical protein